MGEVGRLVLGDRYVPDEEENEGRYEEVLIELNRGVLTSAAGKDDELSSLVVYWKYTEKN